MITLLTGDCRDVLATLPAASVHCVVTSPPYYGLRDYGVDGQLGLEATPDEYIATMVQVFREVRRVLRDDGTCWVNMGDSYAHGASGGGSVFDNGRNDGRVSYETDKPRGRGAFRTNVGLADKQLLMMPARLALALQADGWFLRSDIIWAKPNPMPESVTDRPTNAHEHVYLLAKKPRYYYDADAVREGLAESTVRIHSSEGVQWRAGEWKVEQVGNGHSGLGNGMLRSGYRNLRNVWTIATAPLSSAFSGGSYRIASRDCAVHDRLADLAHVLGCDARQGVYEFGRNPGKRSRPAELPEGAVVSIPVNRSEFPSDVSSATGHSSQSHRTPELSERDVIFGDIPGGHIGCMGFLDHSFAMYARTPASNTSPGASPDEPQSCPPAQSPDRIVGIATYTPRPEGCTCYYAGTVHKRQDHFASFPPELAERCIRAGTSERGCCAQCGKPWVRQIAKPQPPASLRNRSDDTKMAFHSRQTGGGSVLQAWYDANPATTTGWSPGCQCNAEVAPCVVLDCFSGAGTALLVADRLGRDAVGIDLSHAYVEMARARLQADCPLFASIEPSPPPAEDPEDERMADLFAEAAE